MAYLINSPLLRALSAGLALAFSAGGCTQDPPGPVITDTSTTSSTAVNADPHAFADYNQLVWSDEFDGTSLDATKWSYEVQDTWFNSELQATTNRRDNLTVSGGFLNIIALREAYHGKQYTSARIITKGKKDFSFGRLDVKAKLPKGTGLWPAIWMLGANDSQVSWPACGEIDIMEVMGRVPNVNYSTLHYGASTATHQQLGKSYTLPSTVSGDFSTDFHIFSCVRGQNLVEFYIDGVKVPGLSATPDNVSPYPFNNPFYVILNVAVGGNFDGGKVPDASVTFPQTMQVDYVKFFQYK